MWASNMWPGGTWAANFWPIYGAPVAPVGGGAGRFVLLFGLIFGGER